MFAWKPSKVTFGSQNWSIFLKERRLDEDEADSRVLLDEAVRALGGGLLDEVLQHMDSVVDDDILKGKVAGGRGSLG